MNTDTLAYFSEYISSFLDDNVDMKNVNNFQIAEV